MRRWMWWLLPPYGAAIRKRQMLAEMRWQNDEREAARERLIGVARILDEPTAVHPTMRPLLTRGQAARTAPVAGGRPR